MNVAILGAQRTGQSALGKALRLALQADDQPRGVVLVEASTLVDAALRDLQFGDNSLYPQAVEQHRGHDLTLLTGLDLPSACPDLPARAQLLQAQLDARLRQVLDQHGFSYAVLHGSDQDRTRCALQAIAHHRRRTVPQPANAAWQWGCEKCSDAACEHRLLSDLLQRGSVRP